MLHTAFYHVDFTELFVIFKFKPQDDTRTTV